MADPDEELTDGFESITGAQNTATPLTGTLTPPTTPPPPVMPPVAVATKPVAPPVPKDSPEVADLAARAASARAQLVDKIHHQRTELNNELNEAAQAEGMAKAGQVMADKQYDDAFKSLQDNEKRLRETRAKAEAAEKAGKKDEAEDAREDMAILTSAIARANEVSNKAEAESQRYEADAAAQGAKRGALQKEWDDGGQQLRAVEVQVDVMEAKVANLRAVAEHKANAADAESSAALYRQRGYDSEADKQMAVANAEKTAAASAQAAADGAVVDTNVLRSAGIVDAPLLPSTDPVDLNDAAQLDARAAALRARYEARVKSEDREATADEINDLDVKVQLAPRAIELEQGKADAAIKQAQAATARAQAAEDQAAKATSPSEAADLRRQASGDRAAAVAASRVADDAVEDIGRIRADAATQTAQRDQLQAKQAQDTSALDTAEKTIDKIEQRAELLKEVESDRALIAIVKRDNPPGATGEDWKRQAAEAEQRIIANQAKADAIVIDEATLDAGGLTGPPPMPSPPAPPETLAAAGGDDPGAAVAAGAPDLLADVVGGTLDLSTPPADPVPSEPEPEVSDADAGADLDTGTDTADNPPSDGMDLGVDPAPALVELPDPATSYEPDPGPAVEDSNDPVDGGTVDDMDEG